MVLKLRPKLRHKCLSQNKNWSKNQIVDLENRYTPDVQLQSHNSRLIYTLVKNTKKLHNGQGQHVTVTLGQRYCKIDLDNVSYMWNQKEFSGCSDS